MRRSILGTLLTLGLATAFVPAVSRAENVVEETAEHPRIAKAIRELEDAIRYMEEAPHNFGGHKQAAINASRQAVKQLNEAMRYRAKQDTKQGR